MEAFPPWLQTSRIRNIRSVWICTVSLTKMKVRCQISVKPRGLFANQRFSGLGFPEPKRRQPVFRQSQSHIARFRRNAPTISPGIPTNRGHSSPLGASFCLNCFVNRQRTPTRYRRNTPTQATSYTRASPPLCDQRQAPSSPQAPNPPRPSHLLPCRLYAAAELLLSSSVSVTYAWLSACAPTDFVLGWNSRFLA